VQSNIKLNGFLNIKAIKKGISNRTATKEIFIFPHNMMASNYFTNKAGQSETIELTSLDEYCTEQNIKKINCIKVDIEGAEMDLLERAEKTIQSQNDLILIIEFNSQIICKSGNNPLYMYEKLLSFGFVMYTPKEVPLKNPHKVTSFKEISNMEGNLIYIVGTQKFT